MTILIGAVILWVVPIFVTHGQGKAKGRAGIAYGLFLGWIGVLVLAALPPLEAREGRALYRECPSCKEPMRRDATTCPHCRSVSDPWVLHEGVWWDGGVWLNEKTGVWSELEVGKGAR